MTPSPANGPLTMLEAASDRISLWEDAYLRFETPAQEVRKFRRRLRTLGAPSWPADAQIVELFCGRGNGLRALDAMNFTNIAGVEMSARLASLYDGPGQIVVADCRTLPFGRAVRDVLIVQGGLHHLVALPEDLESVLSEAARVLKPTGRLVVVEPWRTPFLSAVHRVSRMKLARALSNRMDAFETMFQNERETYENWLDESEMILSVLKQYFNTEMKGMKWGKLMFVGRPRRRASPVCHPGPP